MQRGRPMQVSKMGSQTQSRSASRMTIRYDRVGLGLLYICTLADRPPMACPHMLTYAVVFCVCSHAYNHAMEKQHHLAVRNCSMYPLTNVARADQGIPSFAAPLMQSSQK